MDSSADIDGIDVPKSVERTHRKRRSPNERYDDRLPIKSVRQHTLAALHRLRLAERKFAPQKILRAKIHAWLAARAEPRLRSTAPALDPTALSMVFQSIATPSTELEYVSDRDGGFKQPLESCKLLTRWALKYFDQPGA